MTCFYWCFCWLGVFLIMDMVAFDVDAITWKRSCVFLTRTVVPIVLASILWIEGTGAKPELLQTYTFVLPWFSFLFGPGVLMAHFYMGDEKAYEWRNICCRCGPPRRRKRGLSAAVTSNINDLVGTTSACSASDNIETAGGGLGTLRFRAFLGFGVRFLWLTATFNAFLTTYWRFDYSVLVHSETHRPYRAFYFGFVKALTFVSMHYAVESLQMVHFRIHAQPILLTWAAVLFPIMMAQCKSPFDVCMFLLSDWCNFLLRVFATVPLFHRYLYFTIFAWTSTTSAC